MRDFNHTVNVLVKAYLNDTLEHGNCYACAVGNIVASSTNRRIERVDSVYPSLIWIGLNDKYPTHRNGWGGVITTCGLDSEIKINRKYYNGEPKKQIDSTGYSIEELGKIEWAFERAERGINGDDWMFNGLMAVIDALAEIHGIDLKQKEEAKAMFVKNT